MKNISKFKKVWITILVAIFISVFCFTTVKASTPTIDSITNNLTQYILGEKTAEFTIETDEEGTMSSSLSGITSEDEADVEITVEDGVITMLATNKEDENQTYEKKINYTITDEKITFDFETNIIIDEEDSEASLEAIGLILADFYYWQPMLFLSVTDEYGIDSNLAYAYFTMAQGEASEGETESEEINIENEVFNLLAQAIEETETSMTVTTQLEIKLSNVKTENFVVEGYVSGDENEAGNNPGNGEGDNNPENGENEGTEDVTDEMAMKTFNEQFEAYKGEQSAANVGQLVNIINESNMIQLKHQIKLTGITELIASNKYIVTLSYDSEGYVNEVNIALKEEPKEPENSTQNAVQNDNTTSNENIPATGKQAIKIVIIITLLFGVIGIIYVKLKDMKF